MNDSSWVPGADGSGFSLANLPYGVAKHAGAHSVCVAIGDFALDLAACAERGLLDELDIPRAVWSANSLNPLLTQTPEAQAALRALCRTLLSGLTARSMVEACLQTRAGLDMACPVAPGDYVDFYSSIHHARRAMRVSRPDADLNANWTSLPVAYHGRTGTIIGPDSPIVRPHGQVAGKQGPVFQPTRALDYELEMGFVIGRPSTHGFPLRAEAYPKTVFGLVLLNDWSARDIQRWESTPLGPFLAKSFATQTGAWVVPLEALEAYRCANPNSPGALGTLRHNEAFGFDIALEVAVQSSAMRDAGLPATVTGRSNTTDLYWDGAQQLAHMTSNGASVRAGDLYGSGTVSGSTDESSGCLLERTAGGQPAIALPDGSKRGWLSDGDEVVMQGWAERPGHPRIDFGVLRGRVSPAIAL